MSYLIAENQRQRKRERQTEKRYIEYKGTMNDCRLVNRNQYKAKVNQSNVIFSMLKGKTANLDFYIQQKYPREIKNFSDQKKNFFFTSRLAL